MYNNYTPNHASGASLPVTVSFTGVELGVIRRVLSQYSMAGVNTKLFAVLLQILHTYIRPQHYGQLYALKPEGELKWSVHGPTRCCCCATQ